MPDIYTIYANVHWWSCSPQALKYIRPPGKSWAMRMSLLSYELAKWGL